MTYTSELAAVVRVVNATAPGVSSVKRDITSLGAFADSIGRNVTSSLTGMVAGFVAVDRVIAATMAGIRNAGELRDLELQIRGVDGSVQEAARSLAFFNEAQDRTRRTGDELATVYGELLPLALAKGFSRESFREVVVQLDQIATRTRQMPTEISEAFAQIMTGKARDKNPILMALGLDADSVKEGKTSADELLAKMRVIAREGEAMGDDFDSSLAKIKDAIGDSFAKGWMNADGATRDGLARIKARMEDPEFQSAIEKLGALIHRAIIGAADVLTNPADIAARGYSWMMPPGMRDHARRHLGGAFSGTYGWATGAFGSATSAPSPFTLGGGNGLTVMPPMGARPALIPPQQYGPFVPPDFVDPELRAKLAEEARRRAEAAEREADAIRDRGEALRFEIDMLRAVGSLKKADIEFDRNSTLATREATAELRAMAAVRAQLIQQAKYDAAIAAAGKPIGQRFDGKTWDQVLTPELPTFLLEVDPSRIEAAFEAASGKLYNDQAQAAAIRKWETAYRGFGLRLSDSLTDALMTGGDNFGRIAATRFSELVVTGSDNLFASVFGTPGDTSKEAFIIGSDGRPVSMGKQVAGQLYNSRGVALSPGRAAFGRNAAAAMDFGSIGVGMYSGITASGQDTPIAMGTVQGAMAGNAVLPGWGALIGAVIGAAATFYGNQSVYDSYKYGIPMIAPNYAGIGSPKNLERIEQDEIIADMVAKYQSTRNAAVRVFMNLGADFDPSAFTAIRGQFQPEASKHWGKHLQQWINNELPDEVLGQTRDQMRTAFAGVGFGEGKFDALWKELDKLDPTKMVSILAGLAKGLVDIAEATDFLGQSNGWGGNTSWFSNLKDVRKEMNRTFAEEIGESFDDLLEKAGYLNDLVGEDQINLLQDIGRIALDIREREKQEMKAILQLQDSIRARAENARDKYTLMGMVKPDGTPDYQAQINFYQGRADRALSNLQNATDREDVDRYYQQFLDYVDQMVSLGYNIDPKYGDKMRLWAMDQLGKGVTASDEALDRIGKDVQAANAKFLAQFQPIFDQFGINVGTVGNGLGGLEDATRKIIPPLGEVFENLVDVNSELGDNVIVLADFRAEVAALTQDLAGLRTEVSSFAARTAALRAAS